MSSETQDKKSTERSRKISIGKLFAKLKTLEKGLKKDLSFSKAVNTSIEMSDMIGTGKTEKKVNQTNQYGYTSDHLEKFCGTYKEEYTIELETNEKTGKLPKSLKIMSFNIWGMIKQHYSGEKYQLVFELMMLRMKKIVNIIITEDPDIVMLQEMSHESLGMINNFLRQKKATKKYKGFGHNFSIIKPGEMEEKLGRDLDTYVLTKYEPNFITQYCIPGNLGYTTGLIMLSFNEICVMGCHLQAGSKYSPGQDKVYHHYSRCRSEQLEAISKIINNKISKESIILCGDFNMDLDGDKKEWPEIEMFNDLKMIDSWRCVYPDKKVQPGLTEDTHINHMRWNMKFIEKQFRYDGIMFKSISKKITPISSVLVGTKGFKMDDDLFDVFMKTMSSINDLSGDHIKIRSQTYHPSDHFGVMTTFSI